MKISARNQLPGVVTETTVGAVMAEVVVDVDASTIVAAITKGSTRRPPSESAGSRAA